MTISAEHVSVDVTLKYQNIDAQCGNYVLVTVSDTGVGIDPKIHNRIFEPFFTTKEIGKGTGLGLAITLGIVKNYGGFLQISSEPAVGTQIQVYLPAFEDKLYLNALAENSDRSTFTPKQMAEHSSTILVVDDDPTVLQTTQMLLESHSYKTLIVPDGFEAISVYTQQLKQIEVVILDVMMPGMNGIELIKELKRLNSSIKIIAISALSENRTPAVDAGAYTFLPKPYAIKELLEIVSDLT